MNGAVCQQPERRGNQENLHVRHSARTAALERIVSAQGDDLGRLSSFIISSGSGSFRTES